MLLALCQPATPGDTPPRSTLPLASQLLQGEVAFNSLVLQATPPELLVSRPGGHQGAGARL